MERQRFSIEPHDVAGLGGSAERLGITLAQRQLTTVKGSYQARYEQGISRFWEQQIYSSQVIGEELAALRLEAQRQLALKVFQTVLMMGVPCGLISAWAFGIAVGVVFLIGSVFLGFYFGSR